MKDGIPNEPIFKIVDSARLVPFPTPDGNALERWRGAYEFDPSPKERETPIQTSGDIYSLGVTTQWFALDVDPVQTREAFRSCQKARALNHPGRLDDNAWNSFWRKLRIAVYRSLNASRTELKGKFDLSYAGRGYEPYSTPPNIWYQTLWNVDEVKRITSRTLVEHLVPYNDSSISTAKEMERAEECLERARKIREQLRAKKAVRLVTLHAKVVPKAPSYEGTIGVSL